MTGVDNFLSELTGKRLELLKEATPTIQKIGVLSNPNGIYKGYEARTKRAAQELQLELGFFRVAQPAALEETFELMKVQHVDAVFVLPDLMFAAQAAHIADLAIKHGLPSMAWDSRLTESGFLLAYSSRLGEQEQRLAFYVDRILKGASPELMPMEQPASYSLSINLRTARVLGLTLPDTLLMLSDEVVE
jgi:putative ABC transport system substrate-binding protein